MPNPSVKRLEFLTPYQFDHVVAMSSQAMKDAPGRSMMIGGDESLSNDLFAAMFRAALLEGELYAVEQDEQIVSVALWFEMSRPLFGTDAQRALGFDDFFKKLLPKTQHWWAHTYPEAIGEWRPQIFTPEENERLTWCYLLATDVAHQNRGFATSLIDAWYDKKGQLVGLATDSELNVAKYKSMGFRERGHIIIDGPDINGLLCVALSKD
ncbi:hypothetical protein OF83DRAFT_1173163 [Amylostereum chailletii]|nr:hypothetical protein OF83DRAFT_1173163 [Amylostereum chailletii]